MGKRVHININVRGTIYPDANAVAAKFKIKPSTVTVACRNGRQHRIGLGRCGAEMMPIRVRGRDFADAGAEAKHFGLSLGAIYQALYRDDVDRIGLPRRRGAANAKTFEIGGLRFVSMAEASLALGFGRGYISQSLRRGTAIPRERIIGAALALAEKRRVGGASRTPKKAPQSGGTCTVAA